MKKLSVLALLFIFSVLPAQTLKSSIKIALDPGETVIQITANFNAYAACTVKNPTTGKKEYSVVTSYGRLGPFKTVKDLQFSDSRGSAIFAAENDSGWFIYEGLAQYGPYKNIKKLAAGQTGFDFVYIADTDGLSLLYYNGKSAGIFAEDFLLSADGKEIVYVKNNAISKEKTVCWKTWTSPVLAEIRNLTISANGLEIGFFSRKANLYSTEKPDEKWTFNFIRNNAFSKPVEFAKQGYKYPGPVLFKPNAGGVYAVFGALRSDGVWELRSETDKLLAEGGEISAVGFYQDELIYSAKPLNASGPDSARYNIIYKGKTAGGPYDDVRAIGTSLECLSLVVRSAAYWYIVVQSGSYGPFADIQLSDSWNAGMFAYTIQSDDEWTSCIGTKSQVGLGYMIKAAGKPYGYAFVDGNTVQIYSVP